MVSWNDIFDVQDDITSFIFSIYLPLSKLINIDIKSLTIRSPRKGSGIKDSISGLIVRQQILYVQTPYFQLNETFFIVWRTSN